MPTIEIVSIGCMTVPTLPDYPGFDFKAESGRPRSHRGLFQKVFNTLEGTIVHLGNKGMERDGFWFAGDLFNWDEYPRFTFRDAIRPDAHDLMERMMAASPARRLTFSTDIQGSARRVVRPRPVTLARFFGLHDERRLRFNRLWHIVP